MSVNIAHLVNRSGQHQSVLNRVERYFRSVAERFKARIVNRSTKDIPIRVADIDILTLGEVFANPEYREGTIYSQISIEGNQDSGYIFIQIALFNKLVNILLGGAMDTSEISVSAREFKGTNERLATRMNEELCQDMMNLKEGKDIILKLLRPSVNRPIITREQKTQEVLCVTFDVGKVNEALGLMTIIMPPSCFEDLLLLGQTRIDSTSPVDVDHLGGVRLDVGVSLLEKFDLTVSELNEQLKEGEVLMLRDAEFGLLLTINGVPMYLGEYVEVGDYRGVKIIGPLPEESVT
jgi:flagellar motor switch protein FliM